MLHCTNPLTFFLWPCSLLCLPLEFLGNNSTIPVRINLYSPLHRSLALGHFIFWQAQHINIYSCQFFFQVFKLPALKHRPNGPRSYSSPICNTSFSFSSLHPEIRSSDSPTILPHEYFTWNDPMPLLFLGIVYTIVCSCLPCRSTVTSHTVIIVLTLSLQIYKLFGIFW